MIRIATALISGALLLLTPVSAEAGHGVCGGRCKPAHHPKKPTTRHVSVPVLGNTAHK